MNPLLKQRNTYIYLSVSIMAIVLALILGIDDNPPGIILVFAGCVLFILIFTQNWHNVKPFLLLSVFSIVGFIISAVLHNVLEAIGGEGSILGIIGVVFFLIAILICPAALLVGIVGSIVSSLRKVNTVKT